MDSGKRWYVTAALPGLLGLLILASGGAVSANHLTNCNQMDGNDNNNTLTGTGGCDEIWSYAGHDVVNGQGGNDEIHLGDDYDWGHGNDGADVIHGGGNGTVNKDELFGQGGFDSLYDTGTSGDADLLCGGPNDDSLNTFDSDNRDQMVGEGGTDSLYDGGDSDGKIQDGACV